MRARPKKNRVSRMERVSYLFCDKNERGEVKTDQNRPLFLEIGCGKGRFALELAKNNESALVLALETVPDILLMAMEKAHEHDWKGSRNIAFLSANAAELETFFAPGSIDKLFLNFSDPWPRKKHAKRRLTSPIFLEKYKRVLKQHGELFFKTDNIELFEYSIETLMAAGFFIRLITRDLHASPQNQHNILTEYEENFSAKGFKINYLEATLKKS